MRATLVQPTSTVALVPSAAESSSLSSVGCKSLQAAQLRPAPDFGTNSEHVEDQGLRIAPRDKCWEQPFPPPNQVRHRVQTNRWPIQSVRCSTSLQTTLLFLKRRSRARFATAFAAVGFKETLAIEIEIVQVPIFGPPSFECLCLGRGSNAEPAQCQNHRSHAHPRLSHALADSALGAGEDGRRNMSFGPDLLQHRVQRIA